MFEDQMVELLPARTTMTSKKGKGKPKKCYGSTTITVIGNFALVDGNNNNVAQATAVSTGDGDANAFAFAGDTSF